ncbi:MAG TPA: TIGR03435 family protein [Bryobacteraceae bacterium]|nr:TIGR03435 family protein [Bryobacteraceae bacterium]
MRRHAPPVSIWFALAPLALLPASGFAQIETERPQFDAASVKVNESGDRPFTRYDPIRVDLHKASIKHLVRRAWPLPDYQIVWPAWVDAQRGRRGYDVSVTFPPDTSPQVLNLMFQDLLVTRFGLVTHWETRELKAFEVRVSEQGSKLQEAKRPAPPTDFPKYTTKAEPGLWHFSSQLGGAPSGLTVAGFLEAIDATRILDRPLVDATGIQGNYDIELSVPADVPQNRPDPSELIRALQKQLGLKVALKTLSLRMLVIDRMERIPTKN